MGQNRQTPERALRLRIDFSYRFGIILHTEPAGEAGYAGVVELADTMVLGAIAQACRFKSCRPHHLKWTSSVHNDKNRLAKPACFCYAMIVLSFQPAQILP